MNRKCIVFMKWLKNYNLTSIDKNLPTVGKELVLSLAALISPDDDDMAFVPATSKQFYSAKNKAKYLQKLLNIFKSSYKKFFN